MIPQEQKEFVKHAFAKLKERGWFPGEEFRPSTITEEEIAAFEEQHQVKLPTLYKAYLTSYLLPTTDNSDICAVIDEMGDFSPLWLTIYTPETMEQVSEWMEVLQIIRDFDELPENCFRNLIPIGNWGAGWGELCIDLSRPEDKIDEEDESTWSLVWFDHEDFDWTEQYLGDDGRLYGHPALPSLKVLLEWYFCGGLEEEFEQETGIKPTYKWYNELLEIGRAHV